MNERKQSFSTTLAENAAALAVGLVWGVVASGIVFLVMSL